jgi:copper chaperone NosL
MTFAHRSIAVWLAVLAACSSATQAQDPVWNKQPCAHCHMLVSDPRTAAQLVTHRGERLYFDDVGCLVEHMLAHPAEIAFAWARDTHGQWLNAFRARYRTGESTPMGYGFTVDDQGALDFLHLQHEIAQRRVARSTP